MEKPSPAPLPHPPHTGGSSTSNPASDEPTVQHNDYPLHAEHGVLIDNIPKFQQEEEEYEHHHDLLWSRIRHTMRDPFMEFCGTMIMIIFGDGSVAQVVLSANPNLPKSSQNKGDYQSISWGWGIGVCLGVYVCGGAGGHLNPAITFVNCVYRGFPWWKFPIYMVAQTLGCLCGAAIIYGNYKSAIDQFEGGPNIRTVPGYSLTATAGVFNTYPQPFLTKTGQVFSEIIASAVLVFVIFAMKDDNNLGAENLIPLMLFFLIFGIGATLGWETGYAINLARDFGPRLFTYMVGYGPHVWTAGDYYFWVPMLCPFIGGTFGGFLYDVIIFTGESPINTPWMGLKRLIRPSRKGVKKGITGKPENKV